MSFFEINDPVFGQYVMGNNLPRALIGSKGQFGLAMRIVFCFQISPTTVSCAGRQITAYPPIARHPITPTATPAICKGA
jgi:hypothetical protein